MLRWVGKRCEGFLGKRYLQLTWLQQQKTLLKKNYKTVKLLDRLLPFHPSRFSERNPVSASWDYSSANVREDNIWSLQNYQTSPRMIYTKETWNISNHFLCHFIKPFFHSTFLRFLCFNRESPLNEGTDVT